MHAYRFKVAGQWREFDLRTLAEIPQSVIRHATKESLMWDVFGWGMVDYLQGMLILDAAPMRLVHDLYTEWQKDSQIKVDEILRLMALIEKHCGPLEADLLDVNLRLRDCPSEHFNWRDLWVFVTYADPNTRIVAVTDPKRAGWDLKAMLLAGIGDDAAWLHWAKTKAAADGKPPPEPIMRPGIKTKGARPGSKTTKPITFARARELAGLDKVKMSEQERKLKLENAFR